MKKIIYFTFFLLSISLSYVYADNTDWQKLELVGKYTNSQPPKPDQTFKVQYRITNATLEYVEAKDYGITFVANTTDKGILEVMFPRNYPYANFAGRDDLYLFINGYGTDAYYLPESTPMMDHVRPKIINDINRPPPHPTTFSEKSDCYFVFYVPFYTFAEIAIGYGSNGLIPSPYYGDDVPEHCIAKTVVDTDITKHSTPLKQFKSGIPSDEIKCRNTLILIQKYDGSPACVKPESIPKLIERGGWAIMISGRTSDANLIAEYCKYSKQNGLPTPWEYHCYDEPLGNPQREMDLGKSAVIIDYKDCNFDDKLSCFEESFDDVCTPTTFIHVDKTVEGDPIFIDVFLKEDCVIHVVHDNRLDMYSSLDNRRITHTVCSNIELINNHIVLDSCNELQPFDDYYELFHIKKEKK